MSFTKGQSYLSAIFQHLYNKLYIVWRLFFHELMKMNHPQKEPEIQSLQFVKYTGTTSGTVQGLRPRVPS